MKTKASVIRIACYLAALCFLALAANPLATLASLAVRRVPPEPPPPSAAGPPTYRIEPGFAPSAPGGPVYDTLTVAQRRARGLPTAVPAAFPYYGQRTVYLTFDDGPDPLVTPAILRILRQAGVSATFFVVGAQVEKHPDILRQIHRDGHAIGNHSYDHIYRHLYRSPAAYTAQLGRTDDILLAALGLRPRISRAPGGSAGSFTREYWAALDEQGYIEVGWNINSGDASRAKAPQLVANIADQLARRPFLASHAIVLMHDGRGHEETARALPEIINIFKSRGFEFRVVNHETPPAW